MHLLFLCSLCLELRRLCSLYISMFNVNKKKWIVWHVNHNTRVIIFWLQLVTDEKEVRWCGREAKERERRRGSSKMELCIPRYGIWMSEYQNKKGEHGYKNPELYRCRFYKDPDSGNFVKICGWVTLQVGQFVSAQHQPAPTSDRFSLGKRNLGWIVSSRHQRGLIRMLQR